MTKTIDIFAPYKLNSFLTLKNRIVMAPLTRNMADSALVPTEAMRQYYARRADAGLIISEGTIIRPDSRGYTNVPGIYTKEQIVGWGRVTSAVHAKGGLMFSQIWHVGRVSHPHFLDGNLPLSPSATQMTSAVKRYPGLTHGQSRAVSLEEIKGLIDSYQQAAENAMQAGFDGIEIHGANGYLVDQFLHYHTNLRTDAYGGKPENLAQFALDVVKACGQAIGYEKVGLRLSPGAYLHEIVGDKRDGRVFQYLLEQLNAFPLAYVHTGNIDDERKFPELNDQTMTTFIREHYHGKVIANGGYDLEKAQAGMDEGRFDLVAIGRPFIANPNFVELAKRNLPMHTYQVEMLNTLY